MPKTTEHVALWEKYQREGVPQKIPTESFWCNERLYVQTATVSSEALVL